MTRMAWIGGLLAIAGMAGAAGCDRDGATTEDTPVAADPAFAAAQSAWRQHRRDALLAVDGWTSLAGLHWLELDAHYLGSSPGSGIRLAFGPPRLGLLQREGGRVFLTPERGVALTLDGTPMTGRAELHADRDASPSTVGFDAGRGSLGLIERGGRVALRVRHADAEARKGFGHLDYWPPDAAWRVEGRFQLHPAGRTIAIANIIGTLEQVPNPGVVVFEREGRAFRLEALDGGDGSLFLILADRTSGHDSYGAGRYLDVGAADADGTVVLDFNHAYNPPCAFTPFATCPLPPPENRLDLAITAGEKRYRAPAPPAAAPGTPAAAPPATAAHAVSRD
ncbi:MAG TPA: DUF1684 domain-containing protein [Luteimonas sp.]|nr:DUF1684 domain-containing protein [Luteimonas sp.]